MNDLEKPTSTSRLTDSLGALSMGALRGASVPSPKP